MSCSNHLWKEPVEIEPAKVQVDLGWSHITDLLDLSTAKELEKKGALKVEGLPLYMGKGPALVWSRKYKQIVTKTARRWKRTCSICGVEQTTEKMAIKEVPDFSGPSYISPDGTVYA